MKTLLKNRPKATQSQPSAPASRGQAKHATTRKTTQPTDMLPKVNTAAMPEVTQAGAHKRNGKLAPALAVTVDTVLSPEAGLKRFNEQDQLVLNGMTQSLTGAIALHEIDRDELFKFAKFKNIADYGLQKMRLAKSSVYKLVNSGRVAKLIQKSPGRRLQPINQAQLRPLLDVHDDDEVLEIWDKALTLFGEGGMTEKAVAATKRQIQKPDSSEAPARTPQEIRTKILKCIRSGWDASQPNERAVLLQAICEFIKGLSDELDRKEISPDLDAILTCIGAQPEAEDVITTVPVQAHNATVTVQGTPPAAQPKAANGKSRNATSAVSFDWKLVNWGLGNADIAATWAKKQHTVKQMRYRHKFGASVKCKPEELQQKLAEEKAKAKAFAKLANLSGV